MIQRLVWRDGGVLSLRLRDDLFTLAQMRVSPYLQFYAVRSATGHWDGTDLAVSETVFCVAVAQRRLKPLFDRVIPGTEVTADTRERPRLMIKPKLDPAGPWPFKGGHLIETDGRGETVGMRVIQADLTAGRDDELIRIHELTNMWVTPEEVSERLTRYFDTGVNWDPHKGQVFPGITPSAT